MRRIKARRRAAVAVMSTGRPMPGSSGITVYAPIGPAGAAGGRGERGGGGGGGGVVVCFFIPPPFAARRVSERNYGTHDDQLGPDTRRRRTAGRADRGAGARAEAAGRGERE